MYWEIGSQLRKKQIKAMSLDAALGGDGNWTLGDCVADPRDDYAVMLDLDAAEQKLECCTAEEKRLLARQAQGYSAAEQAAPLQRNTGYIYRKVFKARQKIRAMEVAV